MKQIAPLFAVIILSTLSFQQGLAAPTCAVIFGPPPTDLTAVFEKYQSEDLASLRADHIGEWIQLEQGQWVRYLMMGESGPVKIHFEGLGGQIETSLNNNNIMEHGKKGRVLVVEFQGQGLTEVHHRLSHKSLQNGSRKIGYDQNIERVSKALPLIMNLEGFTDSDIQSWSGHSFGGLTLAGLMTKRMGFAKPLLELVTPGVANFNLRLISDLSNSQLNFYSSFFNLLLPNYDSLSIQTAIQNLKNDPLFAKFMDDPLQMESVVGLTLGADRVDAVTFPPDFPPNTRVHIFSGEDDVILFNMLHWELAEASRSAGHHTTLVLVEDADHYLPYELSPAQTAAQLRLARKPENYPEPFYYLNRRGHLKVISEDEALQLYKESSLKAWKVQEEGLRKLFGALGQVPHYPESWR